MRNSLPGAPYFVYPRSPAYASASHSYRGAHPTYAQYNYLRPGLIPWMKRRRFELALRLAAPWFHRTPVIDFGCADGVLLPSLSKYFPSVIGVDRDPAACAVATAVIRDLGLTNVEIVCTADSEVLWDRDSRVATSGCRLMFALETMEHACASDPERVAFMRRLFALMQPGGNMIISIPRTTGPLFLLKHAAQRALGIADEPLSVGEAFRAGLRSDTSRLEPRWRGGHLGFNDRTFERAIRESMRVVHRRPTVLSGIYQLALE
jgi:methyltransferase family protein